MRCQARSSKTLFPTLLVAGLFHGCSQSPVVQSFGGETMGSTYEVKVVTDRALGGLKAMVAHELLDFDITFSTWRQNSEILRVNAHVSTEPFAVSPRFRRVLAQALRVAAATDGAFDPTMKPLSDLFRAAKKDPEVGLEDAQLVAARERVGHQKVSIVDGKLVKQHPNLVLDLDGIVAGAAVDAIADKLTALGVASFYLQVTGEVRCRGVKPDGSDWRIGVVDPASDGSDQRAIATLPLRDRSLCSSGDYRNVVAVSGRMVHHLFDPRTGRNPEHTVVSASVIAESCAIADALGTALMVLGDKDGAAMWPALKKLGAQSALLLKPGKENAWDEVKIEWPEQP